MVPTHNSGKPVDPRYEDKAFFAMHIYTELLEQQDKLTAGKLRLIYMKNGDRKDIRTRDVTEESRAKITEEVGRIWEGITRDAKSGEFPPTPNPLCNWCHFQNICPAFRDGKRVF